jgi:hypothetical protein
MRQGLLTAERAREPSWWAHLKFIPINIKLTIFPKKFEENPDFL